MQFDSWQSFWEMGGYGFFVWLSFGVTMLCMLGIVVESWWAKKYIVKQLIAQKARQQRIHKSKQNSVHLSAKLNKVQHADSQGVKNES